MDYRFAEKSLLDSKPLPSSFYHPSAKEVAPALLGHFLLRNTASGPVGGIIVETEAYLVNDPACHAYIGETKRTRTMFGPPGHAYVYFIYGVYNCFNAVCQPRGIAEAVLIRALHPVWGIQQMQLRQDKNDPVKLASGPGNLCAALDISRKHDSLDLTVASSPLYIAENLHRQKIMENLGPVVVTTRIGITRAAEQPLRFYLEGSAAVSKKMSSKRISKIAAQSQ
ncbi:MAG: DNA-3-methyladenine glycosylase [Verrucomicrobiota bacterium]|nr:DNA-3-methyladenine glycosylase [Verrucomicrobiota bacterium]